MLLLKITKENKVRKVAFEIKTEYLLEEDTPQVIE